MNAEAAIARLDRQLAAHGQDVILRTGNTTVGQATVRAFVRDAMPDELIGGHDQAQKKITVSPSDLSSFGEPKADQFVYFDGKPHAIIGEPEKIRIGTTLVRVNMTVEG